MEVYKKGYSDESNLKISEDVLAKIATTAARDVEGFAGFAPGNPAQGVKRAFGKRGEARGISISYEAGEAVVELFINVIYGVSVKQVAIQVQQKVREAIEMMTSINVAKVNVNIVGLVFETENKKAN